MIRTSQMNINFTTQKKKNTMLNILNEYKNVVNQYINIFYQKPKLTIKDCATKIKTTWLSARLQQCACKQAIQNIKSTRKKERSKRYKRYKKVYHKCKENDKHTKFTDKRFSELTLLYKTKPIYQANTMELDGRFVKVGEAKNENMFDIWFHLSSIGQKIKIDLPSKKHKHFNKFFNNDWEPKKSTRLRYNNGQWYLDVFFEKDKPILTKLKNEIGLDIGIKKMLTTSSGDRLGVDIEKIIGKVNNRKLKSKGQRRSIKHLKNYIGQSINEIDWSSLSYVVMEDIVNISKSTKKQKRLNKTMRKKLSHWNQRLILDRIRDRCEENCVHLEFVDPAYTSQTCPMCKHMDRDNRKGENFHCTNCGYCNDADTVGAVNILERGLSEEFIVLPLTKG